MLNLTYNLLFVAYGLMLFLGVPGQLFLFLGKIQ